MEQTFINSRYYSYYICTILTEVIDFFVVLTNHFFFTLPNKHFPFCVRLMLCYYMCINKEFFQFYKYEFVFQKQPSKVSFKIVSLSFNMYELGTIFQKQPTNVQSQKLGFGIYLQDKIDDSFFKFTELTKIVRTCSISLVLIAWTECFYKNCK